MPVASFDRGTKRQCAHCAMKYYDLNRDPVLCPGCGKPYEPPAEPVARKSPGKDAKDTAGASQVETAQADPAAAKAGAEIVSFEGAQAEADGDDVEAEEIPDVEEVEDIGGEVDNSFVENDDDDDLEFKVTKPKGNE